MISEMLRRAREYEKENLPEPESPLLPKLHLTGGTGWINDPNGFSFYRGEYHLFFQYYPYDNNWNSMHWGHAKTNDLIKWQRLPCAMAPDAPFDKDGCFSGSAIEMADGRHLIMYTSVDGELQTQSIAFGDGVNYEKYEGNPVITGADLPEGGSTRDFRDPKLWEEEGRFYAVAGDRCPDGTGAILLFESEDVLHWKYKGKLAQSAGRRGRMWECPDLFALDGTDVLLVSTMEMEEDEPEFIEGNTTLCLIGKYEREKVRFAPEHEQTIDYGLDFYAPQTMAAPDGRRIMTAWMQYWGSTRWHPENLPFFGQMTLPRELSLREGRLYQTPVRELENYRTGKTAYKNIEIREKTELSGIEGRCLDMTVTVRPAAENALKAFSIYLAEGEGFSTEIRYDAERKMILVDREKSGFPADIRGKREFPSGEGDSVTLRIILDRWSLELFVNGGERAASFTLYTPPECAGIRFLAEGKALIDVEKYELEIGNE